MKCEECEMNEECDTDDIMSDKEFDKKYILKTVRCSDCDKKFQYVAKRRYKK